MAEKFEKKELKKRSDNLSDWYSDVILKAEIADYAPVKGTMVIRPYGYAIWDFIQEAFDQMMSERKEGAPQNAYFPLFIPLSFLQKEKDHIAGFSPQLAIVTHGGGEELDEPLVVRPTSETIMYSMYAKWIKSYRDLPMLINQWNNVVRWEKRTYLFLRTTEFLWQEGHTAHATEEEAIKMQEDALEWYRRIYEDYLAVPVVAGIKSQSEKFAGGKNTYSVEALMPDGKALQGGTSHNLGQNFSKVFDISYQDKDEKTQFVWQTSWGLSTRCMGGLFLTHGDDNGLIFPPKIAPIQVIIVPISNEIKLLNYAKSLENDLREIGLRVQVDKRGDQSLGRKINYWELKGVPLRVEIGKNELDSETVTYIRRDDFSKDTIEKTEFINRVGEILDTMQKDRFEIAKKFMDDNTSEVNTYDEFKNIMNTKRGFIKAYWCEDPECEAKIKEETKASTRVRPLIANKETGKCVYCGKDAEHIWYFAQSY